jgi:drug/metabolite transporter (DMT)-like permease
MSAEGWALFSAFCFASSHVVSKRGLQDTSVTAASLIVLSVSWVVVALSVLFDPPAEVTPRAIAVYAALGLLVPAISRWSVLKSVHDLGPSIAIPIQQGLRPLLSVMGGVLLLGEGLSVLRSIGVAAIIIGGWRLSRRPASPAADDAPPAGRFRRLALRPGLAFPIIAGLAYATSDVLIRLTLGDDLAEPGVAAMVSTGSGLFAWLVVVAVLPSVRARVSFGAGALWFVLAGALIGAAVLGVYNALRRGEVSLVSPINSTQPLIVLLLSALFLRDLDRVRWSTVASAGAIVVGAILVAW